MLIFFTEFLASRQYSSQNLLRFGALFSLILFLAGQMISLPSQLQLLSDPFLQLPTETSVRVVWFTEFAGSQHFVKYGQNFNQIVFASTTQLTRTREDQNSKVGEQREKGSIYQQPTPRKIWRHEAEVTGLIPGVKLPYFVTSISENNQTIESDRFILSPQPKPETGVKILLTSDHQLMPMTAANLQKVAETIPQLDGIFFAGDLVNVPDRASEWFDDLRGNSFFPCLQGKANYTLEKNQVETVYQGASLIQNMPLFTAIGNHEVMGVFSEELSLNQQFNHPYPRFLAEILYQKEEEKINPQKDAKIKERWIRNRTFNAETYQEIFTLPNGDKNYYALSFGNIRLVVLYLTNIWRSPSLEPNIKGRYREKQADFNSPENWGYGQHIFESIQPGSEQYQWLEAELNRPEFQQAEYKIVMFHHPPHSLGENIVPAYTDPQQIIEKDNHGNIKMIRYEYPLNQDYLIKDVIPLLEKAGVQLVYYGHSHLWNRFMSPSGMHFLESSNVGNSYGAFLGDKKRSIPVDFTEQYAATGDPNGLEPIIPSLKPLLAEDGQPLPYIASNDITVFSILDTEIGTVTSYYFDTRYPESDVIKFDEFKLEDNKQ